MSNPTLLLRNKTYYLRIRDDQKDRRISLKTSNFEHANVVLLFSRLMTKNMKINLNDIKGWTLESDGNKFKMTTEDNDPDRASAHKVLVDMMLSLEPPSPATTSNAEATQIPASIITVSKALAEYKFYLAKSTSVIKSQRMAESVLNGLVVALGADFDMSKITDEIIESNWIEPRLLKVAKTTVKRDLSFVRSFVNWACAKPQKYSPTPLSITLEAKGESWAYLDQQDLKLIFDKLTEHAVKPWQLWIPIIGLYTGARISEIASIKTADVIKKNEIDTVHLRGTKTNASDRVIPLHNDILQIGFLDFVAARRKSGAEMLFDFPIASSNGPGKAASKWYTSYKRKIGLTNQFKVFHSFRPTMVDHIKQAGVGYDSRCQYVGHDSGGGVHNKVYARKELNLKKLKEDVVDKIDWKTYCGWSPDLNSLKLKADFFLSKKL